MIDNTRPIKIIIFDGVCILCNSAVFFLHKRLRYSNYKFIASQSETGKEYIDRYNLHKISLESIILIYNDKIFIKSDAVLKMIDDMSYKWKVFKIVKIVPPKIRDRLYDFISKYRHIIFGKSNSQH